MYWTYVIQSMQYKKFYIGSTSDLEKRIKRHNKGGSVWTNKYKPWKLIYAEKYTRNSEALKREKQIKSYKGGNAFKKLISVS